MRRFTVVILLAAGLLNLYMLFAIILFKLSPVQPLSLIDQLELVVKHPLLLEQRLQRANFQPFYTIGQALSGEALSGTQRMNLYGNIIIFIPTGVLVALGSHRQAIVNAALASFLISLILECMQLVFLMGVFDVDDLVLNTLGGIVGATLIAFLRFIRKNGVRRTLIEQ